MVDGWRYVPPHNRTRQQPRRPFWQPTWRQAIAFSVAVLIGGMMTLACFRWPVA